MCLQGGRRRIYYFSNEYSGKRSISSCGIITIFIETKQFSGISKLTASFGVALYEQGITREELMQRADIALYEAKNGKNQVCIYRKEKVIFATNCCDFCLIIE